MNKLMEVFGYLGIALTVLGQCAVNFYSWQGQLLWLAANILFLVKAVKQDSGKAEIMRNVIMSAITIGLIIMCFAGVF